MLLSLWGCACAQTIAKPYPGQPPAPDYYIDSVKINFPLFWCNPQNIADINIPKKDEAHPNGAVYMTWKTPHPTFLSLGSISAKQTGLTGAPVAFVIDDSLINDTANVRIEAADIFRVHTINSAQISYWPKDTGPVTILLVETFTSFNKKEPPQGQILHIY
jgi:hypothetical protein